MNYAITVTKLATMSPTIDHYIDWLATAQRLGLKSLGYEFEFGKDDVLHIHGIFRLDRKGIFWNRLRGSPRSYHVYVSPLKTTGDYKRFFKYMSKDNNSMDYVKHHSQEVIWRRAPYSFIEE